MNGPEPTVEKDAGGKTTKLTVDARVVVMVKGESLEERAVILLSGESHGFPVNLADMLEEHFESYQGQAGPIYGPMRITIEGG